jgi:glycoside/pentoside/hexuronide:cation symporter, GPH family
VTDPSTLEPPGAGSSPGGAPPSVVRAAVVEDPRLTVARKSVYATGDFTVNTVLVSLSMIYVAYFLVQVVGLRPELAGAVQLIARSVDAFTDPAMGRLSDLCHWKWGRRRPFFLIGAVPFGLFFALLWVELPLESQWAMFAYYTGVYVLLSLAMTMLSVPYLALLPEMALGYDARTSLNTWRNAGSVLGVFAAISIRPVANAFGGGAAGFAAAGVLFGVLMALPWFAIFAASWERPEFQARPTALSFRDGVRLVMRHATFRRLTGMYLCGRVSMDLVGAMLILYFTHWLGRSGDFEPMMLLFFATVLLALPAWLAIARHREKADVFMIGTLWWMVGSIFLFAVQPDWPRWAVLVFGPVIAIGYAVVDLMPWSMLGEVVDEDDLASGERREGIYNGFFMFVRKLAGTVAVALALGLLGALGYSKGEVQPETAVDAMRWLASLGPACFLGLSAWLARGYPLTRAEHARILDALADRAVAAR